MKVNFPSSVPIYSDRADYVGSHKELETGQDSAAPCSFATVDIDIIATRYTTGLETHRHPMHDDREFS